jgi:small-conductance mechanosensitive channel
LESLLENAKEILEDPTLRSVAIGIAALIAAWLAEVIICRSLAIAAKKTTTDLDDHVIEALRRPIFLSVLFYGVHLSTAHLPLNSQAFYVIHGALKTGAVFLWAGFVFRAGGLFLASLTTRADGNSVLQHRTLPLFEMVLKFASFALAVYFFFLAWDIDLTAWLASAGIIGLAVGFAAQDTLANLFAGIFIIADAPYKVDDFIVLDGVRGRVTRIGIRSTRVLTLDDVEITIPNALIGGSKIMNEAGGPNLKQRVAVAVDAAYGADVDEVRRVLVGCASNIDGVSSQPGPATRFRKFGGSGLSFELLVWVDNPARRDLVLDILHERVYKAFNMAGLEIPYSKHDLYIKESPPRLSL